MYFFDKYNIFQEMNFQSPCKIGLQISSYWSFRDHTVLDKAALCNGN
jgi:hypothetical protein